MTIDLIPIKKEEKHSLEAQLYAYFQEIDTTKIVAKNGKSTINYLYLDSYWSEDKRTPFFILANGSSVGFVLVNDWTVEKSFDADFSIAEFYIQPTFRRKGIGNAAAHQLFDTFKGRWEVRQTISNVTAIQFWRTIIGTYTQGEYLEISRKVGKLTQRIQLFTSQK
ncbi:MAG: GNAT family N-acetyltransferase [Bacteroidota bacterium]